MNSPSTDASQRASARPAEIRLHCFVVRVLDVPPIRRPANHLELQRLGPVGPGQLDTNQTFRGAGANLFIQHLRPIVRVAGLQDDQAAIEYLEYDWGLNEQ